MLLLKIYIVISLMIIAIVGIDYILAEDTGSVESFYAFCIIIVATFVPVFRWKVCQIAASGIKNNILKRLGRD